MTKKVERFKQGRSVSGGSVPLQNLDYNLMSSGSGNGGSGGFRVSPTMISQPSSTLSNLAGNGPPKGYGLSVTRKFKKGGTAKKMATGGSASKRADGCATKGKTKGRFV